MSATHSIKCDDCGKDLTTTGNCEDYYLVVGPRSKSIDTGGSGAVTAMAIYPPVDREYHFCDLRCIDNWRAVTKANAVASRS